MGGFYLRRREDAESAAAGLAEAELQFRAHGFTKFAPLATAA
jgi:hypothetical protein